MADDNAESRAGRGRANLPMIQPNEARNLFFEMVREVEPRVMEELAGEPLRVFREMSALEWDAARVSMVSNRFECRTDPRAHQVEGDLDKAIVVFALQQPSGFTLSSIDEHFSSRGIELQDRIERLVVRGLLHRVGFDPCRLEWESDTQEAVYREIALWMSRWNLDAPWCFVFAFHTLSQWRRNPEDAKDLRLDTHFEDSTPLAELSFRIDFNDLFSDSWWPSEETKAEARARLRGKARDAIEDYLTKVEIRTASWLPRKELTKRDLAMFIGYQLLNQSESRLAEMSKVTQPRVSRIIWRIGAVIGLAPRPPRPAGRPETPWVNSLSAVISE
jgi:hypothetical protein